MTVWALQTWSLNSILSVNRGVELIITCVRLSEADSRCILCSLWQSHTSLQRAAPSEAATVSLTLFCSVIPSVLPARLNKDNWQQQWHTRTYDRLRVCWVNCLSFSECCAVIHIVKYHEMEKHKYRYLNFNCTDKHVCFMRNSVCVHLMFFSC